MPAPASEQYPVFERDTGVVPQSSALFVYSPTLNRFDVLSFASIVHLELMDGTHSIGDIGKELSHRFPTVLPEVLEADSRRLSSFLASRGYVRFERLRRPSRFPLEFPNAWSMPKVVHADVEVTRNCNLRCRYCYDSAGSGIADAPSAMWISLLEVLRSQGLRAVRLSGGEPLCYSPIRELLEHAAHYFIVTVNTNGTLIDDEVADWLASLSLQAVQVSLDSPTPEANDAMRGSGSWQRAVGGIEKLVSRGVPVRIACTVHVGNESLVDEMGAFAAECGTALTFGVMKPVGSARGMDSTSFLSDACRIMQHNSHADDCGMESLEVKCQAQLGFVGITHDGRLKPCSLTPDFFESIGANVVGVIGEDGFSYGESSTFGQVVRSCTSEEPRGVDEHGFPTCVLEGPRTR